MSTSIQAEPSFSRLRSGSHVWLPALLLTASACESSRTAPEVSEAAVSVEEDAAQHDAGSDELGDDLLEGGGRPHDDGATADAAVEGPVVEQGEPCESDAQCDDHVFCNGPERCAKPADGEQSICRRALRLPCSAEHPCQETLKECDCLDDNKDGDPYIARECGGRDCDDSRADCYPGATEVCDPDDRDEDCEPTTYNNQANGRHLDGDADGDGRIDERCKNRDPDTDEWHGGSDCDDHNPSIHSEASEVCDYHDNNCNGFVDEKLSSDGTSEPVHGGLMVTFLPDLDQDLYADQDGEPVRACDFFQPPGYLLATEALDCNDENRRINPAAAERCNGQDDNCDGLTDSADPELVHEYDFPGTTVLCVDGAWLIPADSGCPPGKLWCAGRDPIEQGCRSDATRLSSCRACDTSCQFSCGEEGCDDIVALALGSDHSCGLTREGKLACWGKGEYGRLGSGSTSQSAVPTEVVLADVREIAAGSAHSCAVVGDARELYCWGDNRSWQLGNDTAGEFSSTPVAVFGVGTNARLSGVLQVAAGETHTCALLDTGAVACFGTSAGGRLGNGELAAERSRPIEVQRQQTIPGVPVPLRAFVRDATAVAVGVRHSCLLTASGNVDCWGDNDSGQLGQPLEASNSGFVQRVPQLSAVSKLATGASHTCALGGGAVWCWGANAELQLGRSDDVGESETWIPKLADKLASVIDIAAGAAFSCATRSEGDTSCWGANFGGQLGPAFTGARSNLPVPLPRAAAASVAGGRDHACMIDERSVAYCWGYNYFGQGGNGAPSPKLEEPTQIRALRSAIP